MSRLHTPIRRNDNVVVITGKDAGKRGRVLKVVPVKNRLIVEGVNLIARDHVEHIGHDNGRPRRLDVARPHLCTGRSTERDKLLRLNWNVDTLGVHCAACRRNIVERCDPFLNDGKQRKRDRWKFLFGFSAQTVAARNNSDE